MIPSADSIDEKNTTREHLITKNTFSHASKKLSLRVIAAPCGSKNNKLPLCVVAEQKITTPGVHVVAKIKIGAPLADKSGYTIYLCSDALL